MLSVEVKTKKNLLAFSAGVDSSALFFLLLKQNIPFDIAIVDYNTRTQSKLEVAYAQELATKYNKKIFISNFSSNIKFSEKSARDFRYSFFDKIIEENNYEALITAHQLNDKFEWFMMQLSKGAGLNELLGLKELDNRKNYQVLRPLLQYSKEQLQSFLNENNIKYFIDESNSDHRYKRNFIRDQFTNQFLSNFHEGVQNSLEYLENDLEILEPNYTRYDNELLTIFSFDFIEDIQLIRVIDKELKKRGILITKATRDEILTKKDLVVSHKVAVSIQNHQIFITPYFNDITMEKSFKEKCRLYKIPKNIRPYLSILDQFSFDDIVK